MIILIIILSLILFELLFFSNCRFLWLQAFKVGSLKDKISMIFWTCFVGINRHLFFIESFIFNLFSRVSLKKAIFIIGHNRSGTTKLHKNLIQHIPESVSPGIIDALMPSVVLRYSLGTLMGRYLLKKTEGFQAHKVGVFENEEEDKVFFHRYKSRTWFYLLDKKLRTELWKASDRMTTIDDSDMLFFKNFMKQQIRFKKGSHWVGKPLLLSKNHEVHKRHFPSAKFILLLREPSKAMSSYLNMVHQFNIDSEEDCDIMDFSKKMFLSIEAIVENYNPYKLKVVSFNKLVRNRKPILKEIFNFLELSDFEIQDEIHSKEGHINDPIYLEKAKKFLAKNKLAWERIYSALQYEHVR